MKIILSGTTLLASATHIIHICKFMFLLCNSFDRESRKLEFSGFLFEAIYHILDNFH